MEIPIYYDPMIAKLAVHAKNRTEAIQLIKKAIDNYKIEGVATTLPFGKFVFENEAFISGNFDTHFVKNYFNPKADESKNENFEIAAHLALKLYLEAADNTVAFETSGTNWTRINR